MTKHKWLSTAEEATKRGVTAARIVQLVGDKAYPEKYRKWGPVTHTYTGNGISFTRTSWGWLFRDDAPEPRKAHGRPRKSKRGLDNGA